MMSAPQSRRSSTACCFMVDLPGRKSHAWMDLRTIDLSQSGATRASATKLNELQQPARCWRARVGTCTTGRERFLLRVNAGQHIPPFCGDIPRQSLPGLNVGIIERLARVGRREQSNTHEAATLLHAMGAIDSLHTGRCG